MLDKIGKPADSRIPQDRCISARRCAKTTKTSDAPWVSGDQSDHYKTDIHSGAIDDFHRQAPDITTPTGRSTSAMGAETG